MTQVINRGYRKQNEKEHLKKNGKQVKKKDAMENRISVMYKKRGFK